MSAFLVLILVLEFAWYYCFIAICPGNVFEFPVQLSWKNYKNVLESPGMSWILIFEFMWSPYSSSLDFVFCTTPYIHSWTLCISFHHWIISLSTLFLRFLFHLLILLESPLVDSIVIFIQFVFCDLHIVFDLQLLNACSAIIFKSWVPETNNTSSRKVD